MAEGMQSGSMFRLKGKGNPVLGGRGRGDLYVGVNVITSTNLSGKQRRLLEDLAKIEADGNQDPRHCE